MSGRERMGMGRLVSLLGPAFVASVAYVDPGNVAANLSAGARYGYLLVWVLVGASLMAMLIQYLSAKLGLVTGESLSTLIARWLDERPHGRIWRLGFGAQAFAVAVATDLAEVVGGAIALYLLFGLPTWLGGLIIGAVSLVGLNWLRSRGERFFEVGVTMMLATVAIGFLAGLLWAPPDPARVLAGMVPRFADVGSLQLAAAMLGATVMPHAIYLHSSLSRDRHRPTGKSDAGLDTLLWVQKVDVAASLVVAGSVNVAMLLFGATLLAGVEHTDAIDAAHTALTNGVGSASAVVFGLGLLASSIGSTVVGTHAGARLLRDLAPFPLSPPTRRSLTILPAVALLIVGVNATAALVTSQLVLSFGIAFALIPLVGFTSSPAVMGHRASRPWVKAVYWTITALILALNGAVIVATVVS